MAPEAPAAGTGTAPPAPPAGDPGASTNGTDPGSNGAGTKTFSQAELDRVVQERLARERTKFEGFDDLKRKAAEFDRIQEDQKTEIEKAVTRAAKEASDKTKAETDAAWGRRVVRSEVRVAAAGKLANPEDAAHFIDLDKFKVDPSGDVDTKAIAAAIDDLLKEKPYLAVNGTQQRTPNFDAGTRTPASGGEDMNSIIRRAVGRG